MSNQAINPDVNFVREIIGSGGEPLKKCFQCATCSAVCNITPDSKPFPRKEMIWAQWGLKDRLVKDSDIWLCHQCGDCNVQCPRGAKPGDVLGVLRKFSVAHYSSPKFLGKSVDQKKYLPVLFGIPTAIFLSFIAANKFALPSGEIVFAKFFPQWFIDSVFLLLAALVLISVRSGVARFWKDMRKNYPPISGSTKGIVESVVSALTEILGHSKFKDCILNRDRYAAHLLTLYGFLGLFVTTNVVMLYKYLLGKETPLPLTDPAKILGNVSAALIFVGLILVIRNRFKVGKEKGNYFDWLFIAILSIVVLTGILTELARLAEIAVLAYSMYTAHLIFIFSLIGYLPFSKFAHVVYRTTAIVYRKHSERR